MSLHDDLTKLATEQPELRQHLVPLLRTAYIKKKIEKHMGIEVSSLMARSDGFMVDLAAYCDQYWDQSIKWYTRNYGRLHFRAMGPNGSTLLVEMWKKGSSILGTLGLGGKEDDQIHEDKFRFEGYVSIQGIVQGIDSTAVSATRGWVPR